MPLWLGVGLWVALAVGVGLLASREFGRSGWGWSVLALLLTPLSGLLLFLLPARRRFCPHCGETLPLHALRCPGCARELEEITPEHGLPRRTGIGLMLLVVGVLTVAVIQCERRVDEPPGPTFVVENPVPFSTAVC